MKTIVQPVAPNRKPRKSIVPRATRSKPSTVVLSDPKKWDRDRLFEILDQIRNKRVLVIGDVGVDRYVIGDVDRISPEAPVPIVAVREQRVKLGLAANVAENIQVLGGRPLLVGVVGADRGADDFKALMKASGIVPTHLVVDKNRPTVLKERIVSDRQQLLRVDHESRTPLSEGMSKKVGKKVAELVSKSDAVIVEDYGKGLINEKLARDIFALAQGANKMTLLDPNPNSPRSMYLGAQVLTPNKNEAEVLTGVRITDRESLLRAGRILLDTCHSEIVVITLGKDGMAVFKEEETDCELIPTMTREVYDVSGAGDTVIAVLGMALAAGATIEESVILGNLAAGVEVGKSGTATVTVEEIKGALQFFQK